MREPLDYKLDDDDVYLIEKIADDEFGEIEERVFFFGQLVDDCIYPNGSIDEQSYYSKCPACGHLFQLDKKPENGESVRCPNCDNEGELYDFRDRNVSLDDCYTQNYGLLHAYSGGYVLRLFDVSPDYSEREYDNYDCLDCIPNLSICEVAREYWHMGTVRYYENRNRECVYSDDGSGFEETPTVNDGEYWIVNYQNDFDPMGDSRVEDIIYDDPYHSKTFMESVGNKVHYRTNATLSKYGFERLKIEQIYVPNVFCDSRKISEILEVDYNQVKAAFDMEAFGVSELLSARELNGYGVPITGNNVRIAQRLGQSSEMVLGDGNALKTLKYLRNQVSRAKSFNIVGDYADYVRDCVKLGCDMSISEIRFPSDLKQAHAKMHTLVEIENSRQTEEGVRKAYEQYRHLCEWTDGKYVVIMASSCEDIIHEGIEQHHCVGKYCERVANGEDLILFIRRAENRDKSFYTMEIRPNVKKLSVVQCRGYGNNDESAEIQAFISCYESWFNRRKPTTAPISLMRVYYKAVHKSQDGRYISAWDNKTEYEIGKEITVKMCEDPDRVAAQGIHVASLAFAQKYGDRWSDVAILEIEVNLNDAVIPNAKDQIRVSRGKVLREVPMSEMGEWGKKHIQQAEAVA